jgi:nicotinamide riboside kinase
VKATPSLFITLTGPESTGKTTLAGQLSDHFGWPMTKEIAREVLSFGGSYHEHDVYRMALKQYETIDTAANPDHAFFIADTDLLTYRIWLSYKYGHCAPWLEALSRRQKPVLYLLCKPDIPWEFDPLRENPNELIQLFELYKSHLEEENVPYFIIEGQGKDRILAAISAINSFVGQNHEI